MRTDELLKLVDAGFTKDEILKLSGLDANGEGSASEQEQASDQASDHEQEQQASSNENLDAFTNTFNEMIGKMNESIKKMQALNAQQAEQGSDVNKRTASDIIASIVLPKEEK